MKRVIPILLDMKSSSVVPQINRSSLPLLTIHELIVLYDFFLHLLCLLCRNRVIVLMCRFAFLEMLASGTFSSKSILETIFSSVFNSSTRSMFRVSFVRSV